VNITTVDEALRHVQAEEPLDILAQLEHLQWHADYGGGDERDVWQRAAWLLRNGLD
jgi:hypothetical protein